MSVAKGLTGGYLPLAATLTTERVYEGFLGEYDEFKTFFHGHTYTGNPLACAAALATLEVFEQERTLERVAAHERAALALARGADRAASKRRRGARPRHDGRDRARRIRRSPQRIGHHVTLAAARSAARSCGRWATWSC